MAPLPAPIVGPPPIGTIASQTAEAPKVEVHIDRIEVAQPPAPAPAPRPPAAPPPRGFGEHAAARRFVDRGWS